MDLIIGQPVQNTLVVVEPQCSQRWIRVLDPHISKEQWSSEEETKLLELVGYYGTKAWFKISQIFGNRSDVQCRYKYMQLSKLMSGINSETSLNSLSPLKNNSSDLPKKK